jgi:hypothetical protein
VKVCSMVAQKTVAFLACVLSFPVYRPLHFAYSLTGSCASKPPSTT